MSMASVLVMLSPLNYPPVSAFKVPQPIRSPAGSKAPPAHSLLHPAVECQLGFPLGMAFPEKVCELQWECRGEGGNRERREEGGNVALEM